jgi:hypothetical protein
MTECGEFIEQKLDFAKSPQNTKRKLLTDFLQKKQKLLRQKTKNCNAAGNRGNYKVERLNKIRKNSNKMDRIFRIIIAVLG